MLFGRGFGGFFFCVLFVCLHSNCVINWGGVLRLYRIVELRAGLSFVGRDRSYQIIHSLYPITHSYKF